MTDVIVENETLVLVEASNGGVLLEQPERTAELLTEGLQGPPGPPGPAGADGPAGATGPQGPKGDDGAGIEIAGSVATYAALPGGLTAADSGDGYLVEADGKLYIWSGTAFPADGAGVEFRGPQGPTGPQGDQGIQGIQGPKGDTGAQGATGPTGAKGDAGANGATGATGARGSQWYTGAGAPGTIAGSQPGDKYLDTADGTVYDLS